MSTTNLDQTSFPLFGIQSINSNLFVCAGGGGGAKTGVKNSIHIYKLERDGKSFKANCICEMDTGTRAVMNLDLSPSRDVLAVGLNYLCQLYSLKYTKGKDNEKMVLTATENVATVPEPSNEEDGEYQTSVRITADQKFLISGGSDGSCIIFKYPLLEKKFEIIKAHPAEIDEIDVHPNSKYFVTVSKDASAGLWRIIDGKKEMELPFSLHKKDEDFYRFRNCRFSENKDTNVICLFTTHIPRKYSKEKPANCLVKWNTHKWIPEQTAFIQKQTLCSLAVSANGRYVGLGTAEGSILVYISWNLKHLKTVSGVHKSFVTGLSFIHENKLLCEDMKQDAALLSCSIDNNCQVTLIPSRREYSLTVFFFFFVLVIMAVFNVITYFDLEF